MPVRPMKAVMTTLDRIHLYERKHRESYAIREHHHANVQILYVIEGAGMLRMQEETYALTHDSAMVVLPYADHAVTSDSHLTLLVLEFDDSLLQGLSGSCWGETFVRPCTLLRMNLFQANEIKLLLRKLLFEQQHNQTLGQWAMEVYLMELLLLLSRVQLSSTIANANSLRSERMRSYIDQHYYEPLTAGELSYRFGLSSRHATGIFKEHYQMTPMQYLTDVRVSIAQKLLAESDKDIISISFEVGYESLATFYRVFKKATMMSPSKYRELQRAAPLHKE